MLNTTSEMDVFFDPKSVAIIGASDNPKFGYATTKYLLNSKFKTFPVNLKKPEILGHKAYKNIKDIPEEVELAIIIVGNKGLIIWQARWMWFAKAGGTFAAMSHNVLLCFSPILIKICIK